jgi:hypothetical protein
MPDQSEVAQTLVTLIAGAVYPNGTTQASITGGPVFVAAGWPEATALSTYLANGGVWISVFQMPGDKITSVMMTDGEWVPTGATMIGQEIRRQAKTFKISIWAPTPDLRDTAASPVDVALALTTRFTYVDTSQGLMTYVNSTQNDDEQKAGIYRRDLNYSINYATTQNQSATPISATVTNFTPGTVAGPSVASPITKTQGAPT